MEKGTEKTDNDTTSKTPKKKKSDISNVKVLAGSIAAISVSLLTSKLTSYVGSIVIVGISSILLTVLAKVYENIIKKSKKIAAKATYHLPYGKILPDSVSKSLDDKLRNAMSDTEDTEVNVTVEKVDEEEDEQNEASAHIPESQSSKIKRILYPNSPLTKIILMFFAVAALTTGISWGITTFVEKPNITNVTVKEQKVQQLSDAEKDAIKKAAASEVANQIAEAQSDANTANTTNSTLSKRITTLESTITSLQSEITSLQSSNKTLSKSDDDSSSALTSANSKITSLQSDVASLKTQINELKTQLQESSGSSSSSSSPTTGTE